jgi:tRNA(Phe) wybutosine-synthesizing methylase Tyw3
MYWNKSFKRRIKMDLIGAILNIVFFVLVVFLISRVAHYFNETKNRLNRIEKKLDEIKEYSLKKE